LSGGTGTAINFINYTTSLVAINTPFFGWVRGDGTNTYLSINNATESTTAQANQYGTGSAARDLLVGMQTGGNGGWIGEFMRLTLVNGTLTKAERNNWVNGMRRILHL
jgi:hypothetical protein